MLTIEIKNDDKLVATMKIIDRGSPTKTDIHLYDIKYTSFQSHNCQQIAHDIKDGDGRLISRAFMVIGETPKGKVEIREV